MHNDVGEPVRERLWPTHGVDDRTGRATAAEVQERTRGRWLALWGPYSQKVTVFWRGPAPRGGYCFQSGLDNVWDSIAAAELEMALQYPFGPPLMWR
ncbi:hypothetical protein [Nonomuraea ceibae]|uniref:hypothetical protein n=1 Tax=Nonomuraea ceibae TaxID=1935170 RepID=UPI001C5F9E04|nr:hypothetical protein [Nonomuraea ceibae]